MLFAGCSDGSLLTFSMVNGVFTDPSKYIQHEAGIEILAFNSDYSLLATSSRDRTIKLYFYDEFFERGNVIGGVVHFNDLNSRIRSMIFTRSNKLTAGLSDKSIRLWETSSVKLASSICSTVNRDLTASEWNVMVGEDIPFETCCNKKLPE